MSYYPDVSHGALANLMGIMAGIGRVWWEGWASELVQRCPSQLLLSCVCVRQVFTQELQEEALFLNTQAG